MITPKQIEQTAKETLAGAISDNFKGAVLAGELSGEVDLQCIEDLAFNAVFPTLKALLDERTKLWEALEFKQISESPLLDVHAICEQRDEAKRSEDDCRQIITTYADEVDALTNQLSSATTLIGELADSQETWLMLHPNQATEENRLLLLAARAFTGKNQPQKHNEK